MKKTISINISGVIFHIEEDGYEKLRNYLTTIQQYFSTYEDSQEIITDIENRIAEKLLAKLKAADKQAAPRQVVTLDDVNELIAAMGTVADFEAVEEEEILVTGGGRHSAAGTGPVPPNAPRPENPASGYNAQSAGGGAYAQPRRLVRDLRRKTLGGVAAGLAHYFNWDVVWVRLIFVALVVGLPALMGASGNGDFFGGLSGFTVFTYIAMWIALPGVGTIEEDKTVKKFYRNPEDKVLGGVASGLAAYFGVDIGVIRLLFVVGIVLFGAGFLLYIVLWIISPQANTLTEKMEMQGQPITLSNIEHSIKQNLNINETPNNESTLNRILLFPFRAISVIINGLGSALGPLLNGTVTLIRVIAGITLLVVAFAGMAACLALLGAAVGFGSGLPFNHGGFPVDLFRADVTLPMILSTFFLCFMPSLGLGILGVMLVTNRTVIHSRTALALAGIWLVSMLVFGGTAMPLIRSFQRRGTIEETKVLTVTAPTPTFAMNDNDDDSFQENPSIELAGYEGTTINLVQHFRAQGATRAEAQANARQIDYAYTVRDSVVRFNRAIDLKPGAHFRAQDLDMDLMIPYEKPFRMTEEFAYYIRNEFGTKELERMAGSIWKISRTDGLVCLNFPREKDNQGDEEDNDVTDITEDVQGAVTNELGDDFDRMGANTRQFSVTSFEKVDISGAFAVRFRKGDQVKVVADGREEDLDDINVKVEGGQLKVSIDGKGMFNWGNRKRTGLTITVPTINELHLSGASKASLVGFGNFDNLDLDMSGACRTFFEGTVNKLSVDLSGASNVVLRGQIKTLEVDLSGASKVDANETTIDKAFVDASGASHVNLGHVTSLESKTSGASKVTRQE